MSFLADCRCARFSTAIPFGIAPGEYSSRPLGQSSPSPQQGDAIPVERSLVGDEHQIAPQSLGNQHAIERVALRTGQPPGAFGIGDADGQLLEALAGDARAYAMGQSLRLRKLAEPVLRGYFPSMTPSLTKMSFSSAAMARRAVSTSRGLPASHQMNACVSSRIRTALTAFPELQFLFRKWV